MTLLEHLRELRSRLIRAVIALVLGTAVGYVVFPLILDLLMSPYCAIPESMRSAPECRLVALRPLEPLSVRLKTSVVIGFFVAAPVIFYQLWRFITPGLTRREKRLALPFVLLSQIMFTFGLAFAYYVIPRALPILLRLGGAGIEPMLSADEYFSFLLTMSMAFGLVFEMPLVLVFLSLIGVIDVATLRRIRPYAMVGIFIAAAFITPTTDAVTLLFMAGPMVLFYESSILIAWLIERARRRRSP